MSSDDIQLESSAADIMQDNTDDTIKSDEQTAALAVAGAAASASASASTPSTTAAATSTSTSQQALKQLNQLTANNSNNATGIVKRDTGPASNLQKIEPKLPIQAAKIVYIKNPNGTQQSIRIGGSLIGGNQAASANNLNSNPNASSGTGIQKLQLLQLKNKNVNVAAGSAAAASNSPRFVLKSGPAPQKFILSSGGSGGGTATAAGATAVKIGAAAGPSGTATRTLTVSQAQQMGLIVSTNKTNASASSPTTTKTLILPTGGTAAGIALKNPPTILNKSVKSIQPSKIVIHSDTTVSGGADADAKPKTAAPSIVKVAGTGQQVRVLTGQGKGGLQYVRVLNAIPTANANSATANKIVNGRQQQVFVRCASKGTQQQIASGAAAGGTSTGGGKTQFVTKKLEVMPIGATTKIIKKEPGQQQPIKTPATYLLNNVQKNIVTSSIDIKPVISNQSDSFEITETKDDTMSPKKPFSSRAYSLSGERKSKSPEPNASGLMYSTLKLPSPEPIEGIRRKHCNCTKSQCLKLYCDCFANGEFCSNCNCKECFNTLEKEDERQKAIKICLERNPHAFKPKIGKARDQSDTLRRHTKGCNCKRSGCLKNYCECYEAKIVCSANCKCIGCRNIDDHMENNDRDNSHYEMNQSVKRTYEQRDDKIKTEPTIPAKKPCNFITPDVIEATVQCIIAQADDCLKNECDAKTSERKILEEFGRCLVEIIEFSKKNNDTADE